MAIGILRCTCILSNITRCLYSVIFKHLNGVKEKVGHLQLHGHVFLTGYWFGGGFLVIGR